MEVITEEEFGRPNFNKDSERLLDSGNYEDVEEYLAMAIKSRNADGEFIKGVNAMTKFFDSFPLSTKFLQNISGEKGSRISYILEKTGFEKIDRCKPISELSTSKHKKILITYKFDKLGNVVSDVETKIQYGELTRKNWVKTFDAIIPLKEYNEIKKREKLAEEVALGEFNKKKYWQEICLNNLFGRFEQADFKCGEYFANRTSRQDRKADKVISSKEPQIKLNCPKCKRLVTFPTTPNFESDKNEALAMTLYQLKIQGVLDNGCSKCQTTYNPIGSKWIEQKIIEFVKGIDGGVSFTPEEFCEVYRVNKDVASCSTIKNILEMLCGNEAMVRTKDGKVLIYHK